MEDDLTKKLYQDTILNGRFTNLKVIQDLAGKINIYGENRQIEAMLKAQSAASIIECIGGDEEVTKGIASGTDTRYGKIEIILKKEKKYERRKNGR